MCRAVGGGRLTCFRNPRIDAEKTEKTEKTAPAVWGPARLFTFMLLLFYSPHLPFRRVGSFCASGSWRGIQAVHVRGDARKRECCSVEIRTRRVCPGIGRRSGGLPWQPAVEEMGGEGEGRRRMGGGEMAGSKLLGCAPASEPCLCASAYVLCI